MKRGIDPKEAMNVSEKHFLTGNVIKTAYGRVEIVVEVYRSSKDENAIMCIPIDATNSKSYHTEKDKMRRSSCNCDDGLECEKCHGTGQYEELTYGYNKAEFLASTVKDYILKGLTKNFDF